MMSKLLMREVETATTSFVTRRGKLVTFGSLTAKDDYFLIIRYGLVLAELVEHPRGKEE
jgi:hypothetical protein